MTELESGIYFEIIHETYPKPHAPCPCLFGYYSLKKDRNSAIYQLFIEINKLYLR
jgi:hypothetical protein